MKITAYIPIDLDPAEISKIAKRQNVSTCFKTLSIQEQQSLSDAVAIDLKINNTEGSSVVVLLSEGDTYTVHYRHKSDDVIRSISETGARASEIVFSQYVLQGHAYEINNLTSRTDYSKLGDYVTDNGFVAFDADPRSWIKGNPFFDTLNNDFYDSLINFVLNERGMFPKVWSLPGQKNYWNSTFNGGIPIVRKKDPIHEGTFMLHDIWHFVFPDPVITGRENENEVMAYVVNRLVSEAFTLVLTDMFAVDHSKIESVGYDVCKRKIFPAYKSMSQDTTDLASLKKTLYANTVFALCGEIEEYQKLGVDQVEFDKFVSKYSVFFAVDLRWNQMNIKNQISACSDGVTSGVYLDSIPDIVSDFTTEKLYSKIRTKEGAISLDKAFNLFWEKVVQVINYDTKFNQLAYAKAGAQKYMAGQIYLLFTSALVSRSSLLDDYKKISREIQTVTTMEEFSRLYADFTHLFESVLVHLEDKKVILPDERVTYALHVPHFPPVYSNYDSLKESSRSLRETSQGIFNGRLLYDKNKFSDEVSVQDQERFERKLL